MERLMDTRDAMREQGWEVLSLCLTQFDLTRRDRHTYLTLHSVSDTLSQLH